MLLPEEGEEVNLVKIDPEESRSRRQYMVRIATYFQEPFHVDLKLQKQMMSKFTVCNIM